PRRPAEPHAGAHLSCRRLGGGPVPLVRRPRLGAESALNEGTLVTRVRLRHPALGLTLEFADTVDFHECLLVRRCRVTNEKQRERAVRIFFHHDFHISQVPRSATQPTTSQSDGRCCTTRAAIGSSRMAQCRSTASPARPCWQVRMRFPDCWSGPLLGL